MTLSEEIKEIITEYEMPLLHYANRILRNQGAASDIVQEVFIKYVRFRQKNNDVIQNVSAWLYRVTYNLSLDYIRKHQRVQEIDDEMIENVGDSNNGNPASQLSKKDAESTAWKMVRTLNDREREIVTLKVIEDKSYKEISGIMEISVSNVGFILHATLKKLAKMMTEKLA